jgi:hypothetical protein
MLYGIAQSGKAELKITLQVIATFFAFLLCIFGGTLLLVYVVHFRSSTDRAMLIGTVMLALGGTVLWYQRK